MPKKRVVEADGFPFLVEGWEHLLLDNRLSLGLTAEGVHAHVPIVPWVDAKGKVRHYTADFYERETRTLIEVKSPWSLKPKRRGAAVRKLFGAWVAGYDVRMVVFLDPKGKRWREFRYRQGDADVTLKKMMKEVRL